MNLSTLKEDKGMINQSCNTAKGKV